MGYIKKRILIADDEASIRNSLARLASTIQGYDITAVETGVEVVNLTNSKIFDLILLDIFMPEMNGLEALGKIRAGGMNTKTPVIMVSAHSQLRMVEEAAKLGADDFMVKPFKNQMLLEKVYRYVNANVERKWNNLKPEQEKFLRMSVNTLDILFRSAKEGVALPLGQAHDLSEHLIEVVDKGGVYDILDAIRNHDNHTFTHSLRMGVYMTLFAKSTGRFVGENRINLTMAGLLHDIGKAKITLDIVSKPHSLEPHEEKMMKEHVELGMETLKANPRVQEPTMKICWNHHERLDGSGYPRGLGKEELDIYSRMGAIVEMFSELAEKKGKSTRHAHYEALGTIRNTPEWYDLDLLKYFEATLYQNHAPGQL